MMSDQLQFPVGLRVLVVDENINDLKLLCNDLLKCKFKVTATIKATKALELLRNKKDDYDILITEAKMLDMDGFEFVKIISHEIDIPVIMVSESNGREIVIKSVINGAKDFLVKPLRMNEIKNIWQHVFRKKMFNTPNEASYISMIPSKRKLENEESNNPKKPRVSWSNTLQEKFVNVVNQLGSDAVPKKILESINEPELNRAHIASHLQKYRNDLKKGKKSSTAITSSTYVASTSALTPNPCIWNMLNAADINSVLKIDSSHPIIQKAPINNYAFGHQSCQTLILNSFDVAGVFTSSSGENEGNGTKLDTSPLGFGITLENSVQMELGATKDLNGLARNNNDTYHTSFFDDEELIMSLIEEFNSEDFPTL